MKRAGTSARDLARRLRLGALGGAFGGGAIAFTLMACYGAAPPPCPDGTRNCHHNPDEAPPATSAGSSPESPTDPDAGK